MEKIEFTQDHLVGKRCLIQRNNYSLYGGRSGYIEVIILEVTDGGRFFKAKNMATDDGEKIAFWAHSSEYTVVFLLSSVSKYGATTP